MPLRRDLEVRLGVPVEISNDANCFALAESQFGAAHGKRSVFGVILGTGVGGGIVLDGKALYGAQGIAGEWGHNVLNPSGTQCYCGKQGCVETEISGPALEARYAAWTGERLPLVAIAQRAASGEIEAQALMDFVVDSFAKAIAVVINILDPEIIVLGGGVSNLDQLYSRVPEYLRRYVFNDSVATVLVRNVLGDSAGVFGAALLVARQ
jgi:predicted NBD/HSP70 family sugar kinase